MSLPPDNRNAPADPYLSLTGITKRFARFTALDGVSLDVPRGCLVTFLGPSGCGKTTLLNIISGLVTPSHGTVLFDGRDVTMLAPQERNIAQVFQFPVIYDTMTVFENLAFPLVNRGWKSPQIRTRVHEIAELLELSSDLKNRASGLSADAKQKISLGRGLVRPDVAAILFDEPLTVIDPHLKWLLRRKLKQIHQQLKLSLIYVTHDQVEALTFADTIVVMTQGEIVQSGTPQQLFETPSHTFVGHFIGSPGMNFLPCELHGSSAVVGRNSFAMEPQVVARALQKSGPYKLGIRPEHVECVAEGDADAIQVDVRSVQPMGPHTRVDARFEGHALWIKTRSRMNEGDRRAWVRIPKSRALLYASERWVQS